MKILTQIFILFLIAGCASKELRAEREQEKMSHQAVIDFFKIQAFCSCYKHSFENKDIIKLMWKEDLMGGFDLLAGEQNSALVDSIGKSEATKIKPETYSDFEGKKRITARCLEFYTSKRLDSLAHAKFKLSKSGNLEFNY